MWTDKIRRWFWSVPWADIWVWIRRFFLRPSWKTLPFAMAVLALGAAIPAPAVARFVGWVVGIQWDQFFRHPEKMPDFARLGGACEVLCCYLFGILPLEYLRPRLRRYPKVVTYAAALGCAILGASLGALLSGGKINELLGGAHELRPHHPPLNRIAALSFTLTIAGALLMILVRTVLAEAEIREHALAEAAALAKAHALQAQINPHFFFNTLTTVSALADLDSRAAKELIGQLAELFRYTLSCSRCEMVTLAEELEFVRNYLLIEQARFRRRLRFEMPPAGAGSDIRLPGLTLQPLVENAIRHGIAKRREGGTVRIDLERRDSSRGPWVLSVANQIAVCEDLPSFDPALVFRPGHALANTRDRLALIFGGSATLNFYRDGDEWVKVTLTLPALPEGS